MPLQKYVADSVVSALLEELLLAPCDAGNAPISSSSGNDLTAHVAFSWLLAEQSSPRTPVLHVMFAVMTPPSVVGALPAWLLHPVALLTARFASGDVETVQLILDNDAYFCSTATNTLPASLELQLSNLRKALAPWKEKLRAQIPVQQQQRQQLPQPTTITFGVPAAFAARSVPQQAPQFPSAFDYGRSDITPTGGDGGFARQGGVPVAATAGFGAGGVQGGGMMFGPQSSIFQQQQQPAASQFGSSADPTRGLARYDPITTGGLPGSGPFPYAGGVGVGANIPQIFPGEPDADHLRPWTNGEGFLRGGGGGGRADMFGRGGRGGRRGFGGPPGFL